MAIIYKNQGFSLVTTGTTVLTIGASSRAIVKNIAVTNNHNNTVQIEMGLRDSSASTTFEFYHVDLASETTDNAAGQVLILEENDQIRITVNVTNVVAGVISYALINRSDQNG